MLSVAVIKDKYCSIILIVVITKLENKTVYNKRIQSKKSIYQRYIKLALFLFLIEIASNYNSMKKNSNKKEVSQKRDNNTHYEKKLEYVEGNAFLGEQARIVRDCQTEYPMTDEEIEKN